MTQTITFYLQELDIIVQVLKKLMPNYHVFAFIGPLGAGKTMVIKRLLHSCGITQNITSPTFTYVNEYQNKENQTFYHFDLYRIKSLEEFRLNGFDEYLFKPNSWVFIEWPEVIESLLKHNVCHIRFDYHQEHDKRIVHITCLP